jgi:hypothetical protein
MIAPCVSVRARSDRSGGIRNVGGRPARAWWSAPALNQLLTSWNGAIARGCASGLAQHRAFELCDPPAGLPSAGSVMAVGSIFKKPEGRRVFRRWLAMARVALSLRATRAPYECVAR